MNNPTEDIQIITDSLVENEVTKQPVNTEYQKDIKHEDRDFSSQNSKTTREIDSNKKTNPTTTEESNKSHSINVEHSEFGRNTPSNASKNPSQTHSKNPSLMQKIDQYDQNNLDMNNSRNVNYTSNFASKINDNIGNSNIYRDFSNPETQNVNNQNVYKINYSTPKNYSNNPNFLTTNLKDDLNRMKINYDLNLNSNNPNTNYNSMPINDYTNLRTGGIGNYTIPNIQTNPNYNNYNNNYNSYDNSLINSNYNPNSSTPTYLNFNTNPTAKSNEIVITSLPATSYHKFPTTPATSGVLNTFVPQYFESTYINPSYKNKSYQPTNTDFYGSTTSVNFKQVYDSLSSKAKPPNDLSSKEEKETVLAESLKDLIKFDNFPGDYECESKGKYTKLLAEKIKNLNAITNSNQVSDSESSNLHFSKDADKSNFCDTHHEIEDYILFEDIENYKKHEKICKNCLSMLKMRKGPGGKVDARLYYEIILDNKDTLSAIKSNKINFEEIVTSKNNFADANIFIKENILPLADEIIQICESFTDEINTSLNPNFQLDEFRKFKEFIDTIDLGADGAPNIFVTGADKNKTIFKHISLASFLINMSSNTMNFFAFGENENQPTNHQKGVSEKLKNFVIKISKLRKLMVTNLSLFIKFLLGSFYDFIFSLEGLAADQEFKPLVQLDYVNAEELSRIKLIYDSELQMKEEKINSLEEENIRMKHELEILRSNFAHFSEQESYIQKLKQDLTKLEEERNTQNLNINNLLSENERLTKQNNEIFSTNEMLKNDLQNLKAELEARFRSAFEQLKSEYEKKIIAIGSDLNETRFKLAEIEQKYNLDIRNLTIERDGLLNKIAGMQQRYEMDMKALKEQLDAFLREYNNTQKNLNQHVMQITALNQEKDSAKIALENAKVQISNYENTIQNQSNQIGALLKERDDFRQQMAHIRGEAENLRAELNNQVNMRSGLESVLIESRKKGDELINALNAVKTEFANKLTIIPQLEAQVRDLKNTNGQLNSQVTGYQNELQRQDNENKELKRIIDEMKIKLFQSAEKDNEIARLKQTLVSCREEWARLSEAYEGLVKDIKNQLTVNDGLRAFIYELQMKIENHNNQIINLDQAIKHQIENLARQSLQKKVIEYNPNTEAIIKSHNETEAVKNKIGRMEAQNITRSQVFNSGNNNNNIPNMFQFGQMGRDLREFSPKAPIQNLVALSHTVPMVPVNNIPVNLASNAPQQSTNFSMNLGTNVLNTSSGLNQEQHDASVSGRNVNNNNNERKKSSSESIIKEIEALSGDKETRRENEESS